VSSAAATAQSSETGIRGSEKMEQEAEAEEDEERQSGLDQ
jgi:hypothetical protein